MSSSSPTTPTPQRRYHQHRLHGELHHEDDDASTPLVRYFSRKRNTTIRFRDLPTEPGYIGHYSVCGLVNALLFLTVPIVYIYIAFILLRELCMAFPESLYQGIHQYLPHLAWLVRNMEQSSSLLVEVWCVIEGIFYIALKLQIQWLQLKDPLEASLSAAPMMDLTERALLWSRMMKTMTASTMTTHHIVTEHNNCNHDTDAAAASSSSSSMASCRPTTQDTNPMTKQFHDDSIHHMDKDRDSKTLDTTTTTTVETTTTSTITTTTQTTIEDANSLAEFISGWFFDAPLDAISRYDVRDFLCWSLFESRNQEHLTGEEFQQLGAFLEELELVLSFEIYGEEEVDKEEQQQEEECAVSDSVQDDSSDQVSKKRTPKLKRPKKVFRFDESSNEEPHFLSTLYENYKQRYEQARHILENTQPVQDLCNMMLETEKKTLATASHMYENASTTATHMAANAYDTFIGTGSNMDKQLSALGHATQQQLSELSNMTQQQLAEAWNTVKGMKERLEKADFLSRQTKRLKQQLKGYRVLLFRMREMSSSVPSKQMAKMMRSITECNESMEKLESRAMDAILMGTGFLRKNILGQEPKRYAKYSSDPLLGVSTYPLGCHLFVLGATEIPLRIMMKNRGFTRLSTGPVAYYFHPGKLFLENDEERTPIVFVHGIGVGLIVYIPLIDQLIKTGRPIFCPEIPYVSGFRPWQSPNSVLPPAVVCSTMTEMLAIHGHLKGTFCGHSYGTTWLSYMCKYAPHAIVAVCFLDPVCFCLHMPRLTKQFVYHRPDPGTVAYMVRTDVIVSWTIQRCFPWAWIALFAEQIQVPCAVFLSDGDMLVPSLKVEQYLKGQGAPCMDFAHVTKEHFSQSPINLTIFRGDVHGGWTERSDTCPMIATCVEVLCDKVDSSSMSTMASSLSS